MFAMKKVVFFTALYFIAVCLCQQDASLNFRLLCRKRIDYRSFRSVTVKSAVDCCTECMRDKRCGAVTVNAANGLCLLNELNGIDLGFCNFKLPIDRSWKVFQLVFSCDPGWTFFQRSCYGYYIGKYNWTGAKKKCAELNAHILKIETAAEIKFLKDYIGGPSWIGLRNKNGDGNFVWESDGSIPTFTDWAENNPGNQNCVREEGGKWYTRNCSDYYWNGWCEQPAQFGA